MKSCEKKMSKKIQDKGHQVQDYKELKKKKKKAQKGSEISTGEDVK